MTLKLGGHFNGPAYVPSRDHARLTGQIKRVFDVVQDQRWHSVAEIAAATGDPENSVQAQLRHLRKRRFGGFTVQRRHLHNGFFKYRLLLK